MGRSATVYGIITGMGLVTAAAAWGGDTIDLTKGWRFAPDPNQEGVDKGWMCVGFDDSSWAVIDAGKRWEDQGFPEVDGHAWYRKSVMVPVDMRAPHIWLNLGGINDSGVFYCNGQKIAEFGDEVESSMTSVPIAADLAAHIRWGERNLLAIRAFDQGLSGGLTKRLCALTTDQSSLPANWQLRFVPGFDGRPSIVGLQMDWQGLDEAARLRVALSVNDGTPVVKEVAAVADFQGRSIGAARFDLAAGPGDRVHMTAEITGAPGALGSEMSFKQTYEWPKRPRWPGEYGDLRVLNNFVTELKAIERIREQVSHHTFLNPREGWVFFRVEGDAEPIAHVDNEPEPFIWRVHPVTGALEAMRYLEEGEHLLRLQHAQGAGLEIRSVPETAFCYWPTQAALKALPDRDPDFAEQHVFPNMTTLIASGNMTNTTFDSWRAEGRRWLSSSGLVGLAEDTPPTVDDVYQMWATNAAVTRPGYSGMIVDEFLGKSAGHYAAWTEALERLYSTPGFEGQNFYAWCTNIFAHLPAQEFMRKAHDLGARFAWMRYCHEEPTEELALLHIYEQLGGLQEWSTLMPNVKERLTVCFGSFTTPCISLNLNPGVNYIPYMDAQFRVLATDPAFFGLLGVFQWSAHYTDDDVLRYAQALYRHYCIEGERAPYRNYPYVLNHITNPDFDDGLDGWRVKAARPDSIVSGTYEGLGKIQGRWKPFGAGDRCAIMLRTDSRPNRIKQTVKNLEPGLLYTMKYIAADLDHLDSEKETGLWVVLEGVELIPNRSFRCVMPSPYRLKLGESNREEWAYTTYCRIMFRAESATAELTLSDWKDGKPAGPAGQRIAFNFVELQPFFEYGLDGTGKGLHDYD